MQEDSPPWAHCCVTTHCSASLQESMQHTKDTIKDPRYWLREPDSTAVSHYWQCERDSPAVSHQPAQYQAHTTTPQPVTLQVLQLLTTAHLPPTCDEAAAEAGSDCNKEAQQPSLPWCSGRRQHHVRCPYRYCYSLAQQ
jgi:hypothetical protein